MPDWRARLRERMAAEGLMPSAHGEAIDEIAEHLNDLHRAAEAGGRSTDEAAAVVEAELLRMGPLAITVADRAKRQHNANPHASDWRAGIVADARHALRSLRLNRGFSAIVVITLAIGVGACTTVFSIVNALLLGSLPYPDPARLVLLWENDPAEPGSTYIVAEPVYQDWKRETRSFSSIGIWEYQTFNVASAQEPEQVQGIRASESLFRTLGVPPALGRVFTVAEEQPGHRVAVVSDAVWHVHLGADRAAIGRALRLNGETYEVIGVMPPGFDFPRKGTGVWVPIAFTGQDRERDSHSFWVAGRLAPGVSFENARADIDQVGAALRQRYPENSDESSTITHMADQGLGQLRTMLTALMGAVVLVLVIGCVNVANLQLGKAMARRKEFVVRLALGASLGRLARQLFSESLALAIGGGLGGLMLTWAATRAADLVLAPGFRSLPFRGEVPIVMDGRVLLFAVITALLSAALFGFAPLIGLKRREPQTLLRDGGRGSTGTAQIARRVLVTVEVAMAVVVLCGAGLLIKSLAALMQVNPGLDPREVLTLQVSLPQEDTYGQPVRENFCADLSRNAEGIPGIRSIAAISHLPLSGASAGRALTIEGRPAPVPADGVNGAYRLTCPGYFATMSIPLVEGRDFTDRDVTNGARVMIVNRAMAARYWPGETPVGQHVKIGARANNTNPWMTVIGIAENARHFGLDSDARREIYLPYSQQAWPVMTIVAKTVGEPAAWQTVLRGIVKRVDPDLPVAQIRSMEDVVATSVGRRETPMRLLTGFAGIGLLLAAIGVYGVLGYFVSQRTREIGVRAALGATRSQLGGMVIKQSMVPITAGLVLGVAGSFASGRLLQDMLYQVKPGDPEVIGVIVLLLLIVGLLASWLPARRAAGIDPMVALRED
jgi:putative ABC transport system permease protein